MRNHCLLFVGARGARGSLYLGVYGKLRQVFLSEEEDGIVHAWASSYPKWFKSGVAGAAASTCCFSVMLPMDTVRTGASPARVCVLALLLLPISYYY